MLANARQREGSEQVLASLRFLRERCCDLRASAGLALGGIPAVLAAEYLIKKTDLNVLIWIVLAVVVYTAVSLLLAARKSSAAACIGAEATSQPE